MSSILRKLFALCLVPMLAIAASACAAENDAPYLGVDVSELLSQEASGVLYYNAAGEADDALRVLADHGVDHVRLRVWNDPFDAEGHGYGAGNIDASAAAALSARAAACGMKTLIDFHYSDFWADPSRQLAPKAWADMSLSRKTSALASYTRNTLSQILDAGGDVDMVQIGNETNYGMCGESGEAMAQLIAAGCAAARETAEAYGRAITVCVHLADPQNYGQISGTLWMVTDAGADFDAVALSYYPYWHGGLDALSAALLNIRQEFGKDAFVAETSWPFTLETGDFYGDVVNYEPGQYPASPEGQAQAFADIWRTALEDQALGVFYWGGIWTPVLGGSYEANSVLWETYGSGWASSYAAPYDPEHVGDAYGGSAWDNQALFDFTGHPLPILDTFRALKQGSAVEYAEAPAQAAPANAEVLPDVNNLVLDPGFEEADHAPWILSSAYDELPCDYQDFVNDAHTGTFALHYWSENPIHFFAHQTLTDLPEGMYEASVWSQGGDMRDAELTLYVIADGQRYETSFMNTTWADWQHPELRDIPVTQGTLTIGVEIQCAALGWGTLDDFQVSLMP